MFVDVVARRRIKGYLMPTRGIGDGVYKLPIFNEVLKKKKNKVWRPPYTTAEPQIIVRQLTPDDKFIVMATGM